jgi:hypothetical protein
MNPAMLMMMMMVMGVAGMFLLCCVGYVLMNSDFMGGGSETSPPAASPTTTEQENCYVTAHTACDGKKGKSRDYCISDQKKKCLSKGGKWDTLNGKDDLNKKKSMITQDWDGQEVEVPGSALNDTNQNCVYFYDSDDWSRTGKVPDNRGEWCIDRDGVMNAPQAIWYLKNKTGVRSDNTRFNDIMDFARIGRNVKLTVYQDFANGRGSNENTYYGNASGKEGKLILVGRGRNTVSGFQVQSIK